MLTTERLKVLNALPVTKLRDIASSLPVPLPLGSTVWKKVPKKTINEILSVLVDSPISLGGLTPTQEAVLSAVGELRHLIPIKCRLSMGACGHISPPTSNPSFLLPAMRKILCVFEESNQSNARLFSLLPRKSGFTLSYIPISSQFLARILCSSKVEPKARAHDDATKMREYWAKHFNLKAVETSTSKFANRIVTDGVSVSILLDKPSALCPRPECVTNDVLMEWLAAGATASGVDPGVTDVVNTRSAKSAAGPVDKQGNIPTSNEKSTSYTSAQYYQDAKFNLSSRRTARWNAQTEDITKKIPCGDTACMDRMVEHAKAYIQHLPMLLAHRSHRGYRNMRFMRYIYKQKAIDAICDLIAPKDSKTIVGFGNWSGVGSTPISRRTCGPLQAVKRRLMERHGTSLLFLSIDEFRTSKLCCCCHKELNNMYGKSFNWKTKKTSVDSRKIHKVLHCKNSMCRQDNGVSGRTWNRDDNASRNILKILLLDIHGMSRPLEFQR